MEFNPHDNKTSDGVVITEGMAVLDYDRKVGTVLADCTSNLIHDSGYRDGDHWFDVQRTDGSVQMFNGTRLLARQKR